MDIKSSQLSDTLTSVLYVKEHYLGNLVHIRILKKQEGKPIEPILIFYRNSVQCIYYVSNIPTKEEKARYNPWFSCSLRNKKRSRYLESASPKRAQACNYGVGGGILNIEARM